MIAFFLVFSFIMKLFNSLASPIFPENSFQADNNVFYLVGKAILNGKVLYRECKYVSDFEYDVISTGEHIVEDVKGIVLPIFKIKQKLMYDKFGVEVRVVKKW